MHGFYLLRCAKLSTLFVTIIKPLQVTRFNFLVANKVCQNAACECAPGGLEAGASISLSRFVRIQAIKIVTKYQG